MRYVNDALNLEMRAVIQGEDALKEVFQMWCGSLSNEDSEERMALRITKVRCLFSMTRQ